MPLRAERFASCRQWFMFVSLTSSVATQHSSTLRQFTLKALYIDQEILHPVMGLVGWAVWC